MLEKIASNLFQIHGSRKNFSGFLGNAFTVTQSGERRLITAAHVIKGSDDLAIKSPVTGEEFTGLRFSSRGFMTDMAQARIVGTQGLDIAPRITSEETLTIFSYLPYFSFDLFRSFLRIIRIDRSEFTYVRLSGDQTGIPGSSGSPILNENGLVVGVNCTVTEINGVRWGGAGRLK